MADINIDAITDSLNNKVDLPSVATSQDDIDFVIEWQKPTTDNDYTWYRKYKSGWVEQGGKGASNSGNTPFGVVLPVKMSDANYNIQVTGADSVGGGSYLTACYCNQTTTGFECFSAGVGSWYANTMYWKVSGMAA